MNTFHYFSYGSNMLVERLQARCPSAKLLGIGEARGYELKFSKKSKDGSGKAMPCQCHLDSEVVYGILFEISNDQLKALDRAEGKGYGYDRVNDFRVYSGDDGIEHKVTTYIANADFIDPGLQPFDWYLALVIAGARQHALPAEYIDRLRTVSNISDENITRTSDALRIIQKAGFADIRDLL